MPSKKKKYIFPTTKHEAITPYSIKPQSPTMYEKHPYFSFRYYDKKRRELTFDNFRDKKEFTTFFDRLERLSQETWKDILVTKRTFYHAHEVNWDDTAYKAGFSHLDKSLRDYPVFQFEAFKECRVFGFFNADNVFKIVWVDRNHKVYPAKK